MKEKDAFSIGQMQARLATGVASLALFSFAYGAGCLYLLV